MLNRNSIKFENDQLEVEHRARPADEDSIRLEADFQQLDE